MTQDWSDFLTNRDAFFARSAYSSAWSVWSELSSGLTDGSRRDSCWAEGAMDDDEDEDDEEDEEDDEDEEEREGRGIFEL